MKSRIINFNSCWIKTITFDNSKEFTYSHKIAKDHMLKLISQDHTTLNIKEQLRIE